MNINEALIEMKRDNSVNEVGVKTGWYNLFGNTVCFSCVGEYPCCHYEMTIEEFLNDFKNSEFEV
jgi:hypothetical protein